MTPVLPELERQLIALPDRSATPKHRRRSRVRLGSAIPVISVLVTLVIAAAALTLLRAPRRSASGTHPTKTLNARQAKLVAVLGVMGEPQSESAAAFDHAGWPTPPLAHTQLDRPLIRLATTTSWGAKVFIVAIKPPRNHTLARELGEVAALWVQGLGWSDFSTVSDIKSGDAFGPGKEQTGKNGQLVYRFFEIVPNRVRRVVFYVSSHWPAPGKPPNFKAQISSIPHNNVAVFQDHYGNTGVYAAWYSASGHLIKRVGNWNASP